MCAAARESDKGPGEAGNEAGGEAGRSPGGEEPRAPPASRSPPTPAFCILKERNNKKELQRKVVGEISSQSHLLSVFPGEPGYAGLSSHT